MHNNSLRTHKRPCHTSGTKWNSKKCAVWPGAPGCSGSPEHVGRTRRESILQADTTCELLGV
jgi:hypothetical protein